MELPEVKKQETGLIQSSLIGAAEMELSKDIESAVMELNSGKYSGFALAIAKAKVVSMISKALTSEMMKPVMEMQGKAYGFKIDLKGKDTYKEEIVRDCMIEATLSGLEFTGNQFNIIGGNMYAAKNGCTHILLKNGVQNEVSFQLSKEIDGVTVCPTTISWVTRDGKTGKQTIEFPVKVYKGITTEENIQGRCERKIKSWLIEKLTGIIIKDGDTDKTVNGVVDGGYAEVVKEHAENNPVEVVKEKVEGEVVVELTDEEKKMQKDGDDYIRRSATIENLMTRKSQIIAKFPKYDLKVVDEMISKLSQS